MGIPPKHSPSRDIGDISNWAKVLVEGVKKGGGSFGQRNDEELANFKKRVLEGFATHLLQEGTIQAFDGILGSIFPNRPGRGGWMEVSKGKQFNINAKSTSGTKSNAYGAFFEQSMFGFSTGGGAGVSGQELDEPDIQNIMKYYDEVLDPIGVELKATRTTSSGTPLRAGSITVTGLPPGVYYKDKNGKSQKSQMGEELLDRIRRDVALNEMIKKMQNLLYIFFEEKFGTTQIRIEELTLFAELVLKTLIDKIYSGKSMSIVGVDISSKDYGDTGKIDKNGIPIWKQAFVIRLSQTRNAQGIITFAELYKLEIDLLSHIKTNPKLLKQLYGYTKRDIIGNQTIYSTLAEKPIPAD